MEETWRDTVGNAYRVDTKYDFGDADIIIAVPGINGAQSGTTYFKVHKMMLKLYAGAFSDMLQLANPNVEASNGLPAEFTQGLPVVQMHDSLEPVRSLLGFMYYPEAVPSILRGEHTGEYHLRLFQIAEKYDMPRIVDFTISRIKEEWPMTLREWDLWDSIQKKGQLEFWSHAHSSQGPIIDAVRLIRLGRDLPLPSILPTAFYHLARQDPLSPRRQTHSMQLLDVNDYEAVRTGQARLRQWLRQLCKSPELPWSCPPEWYYHLTERELDRKYTFCNKDFTEQWLWWETGVQPKLEEALATDPLDVLRALKWLAQTQGENIWQLTDDTDFCAYCRQASTEWLENQRQEVWNLLPSFFGLANPEGWGESEAD